MLGPSATVFPELGKLPYRFVRPLHHADSTAAGLLAWGAFPPGVAPGTVRLLRYSSLLVCCPFCPGAGTGAYLGSRPRPVRADTAKPVRPDMARPGSLRPQVGAAARDRPAQGTAFQEGRGAEGRTGLALPRVRTALAGEKGSQPPGASAEQGANETIGERPDPRGLQVADGHDHPRHRRRRGPRGRDCWRWGRRGGERLQEGRLRSSHPVEENPAQPAAGPGEDPEQDAARGPAVRTIFQCSLSPKPPSGASSPSPTEYRQPGAAAERKGVERSVPCAKRAPG